jgi:transglutaminase-like putative cysteine protease
MLIRTGFDIAIGVREPTALLMMLSLHPSRTTDLRSPHQMRFSPHVDAWDYTDGFGNTVTRILAPPGVTTISTSFLVEDSGEPDIVAPGAQQVPVELLPPDVLVFLLGSRYCETDKLSDLAWWLFGNTPTGWARVQAICDYVHNRIRFDYGQARSTRTAWEGNEERVGVCRDFAHLAVAFCRCMNIPARYCTGYLGDIGIPPADSPMDFSAWFDVYLDGRWYTFDARHNRPRIGRLLMARGRDATDVALTTSFGSSTLERFDVHTDEVVG